MLITPQPYPPSWAESAADWRHPQVPSPRWTVPLADTDVGGAGVRRVDLTAVNDAMHRLISSADPATVFGHLAQLCVPAVCDRAEVDVLTGDRLARWQKVSTFGPRPPRPEAISAEQIPAGYEPAACDSYAVTVYGAPRIDRSRHTDQQPDFLAVLTCTWCSGYRPARPDVALLELLVRCAATTVDQAWQAQRLTAQQLEIVHLHVALDNNRSIGAAIGVLMTRHQLTYRQGFDLLRAASQNSNRKLADVADIVRVTGALPQPPRPVDPLQEKATGSSSRLDQRGDRTAET